MPGCAWARGPEAVGGEAADKGVHSKLTRFWWAGMETCPSYSHLRQTSYVPLFIKTATNQRRTVYLSFWSLPALCVPGPISDDTRDVSEQTESQPESSFSSCKNTNHSLRPPPYNLLKTKLFSKGPISKQQLHSQPCELGGGDTIQFIAITFHGKAQRTRRSASGTMMCPWKGTGERCVSKTTRLGSGCPLSCRPAGQVGEERGLPRQQCG